MMVESLAGKQACMQGHCYDATPFTTTEKKSSMEIFAEYLQEGNNLSAADFISSNYWLI